MSTAKKGTAKKRPAKKSPAKKRLAGKPPAKKSAAKKTASKKAPAKKPARAKAGTKPATRTSSTKKAAPAKPLPKKTTSARAASPKTTRSDDGRGKMQYPPGVYDIFLGTTGELRFARILALGGTLPNVPGIAWKKNKEHWFTSASILNLANALGGSTTIRVRYTQTLANLDVVAAELADSKLYVWQGIYAKEQLSPADWSPGSPTYGTPAFYYAQTGALPDVTMRIVFEPSPTIGTQLLVITWLSTTDQLSTYFPGASPGTTITLPTGGWPPSVSPSFYFSATP